MPLWIVIPVWLERETERGRTPARWLFALLLAFSAVGHGLAAAAWAELSEQEGRDDVQLAVSAVLAVGYVAGAVVLGFSPAVGRAVAAGRAGRRPGGHRSPAEPGAASDRPGR